MSRFVNSKHEKGEMLLRIDAWARQDNLGNMEEMIFA